MAKAGQSLVFIALSGLALVLLVLTLSPGDAEAQLPAIDVSLEEVDRDQTAHVTRADDEQLKFDGNVTVDNVVWFPSRQVVVELDLSIPAADPVWDFNINPPTLTYSASGSMNFTATVTVPPGLLATEFFTLVFSASTDDIAVYDSSDANALVHISPFYQIRRQFSSEPLRVKQGESLEFNLTLINWGNIQDTFSLELTNEDELNIFGLTVFFNKQKRINPGQEAEVDLRLEASKDATEGPFQLNITIKSEGSASDPEAETVVNFASYDIIVEASLTRTLVKNWYYLVGGVVALVVVAVVVVKWRRSKRASAEEEDEGEDLDEEDGIDVEALDGEEDDLDD